MEIMLKYKEMSFSIFSAHWLHEGAAALVLLAILALLELMGRMKHRKVHYVFAFFLGTALSIGLVNVTGLLMGSPMQQNPYVMALAIVVLFAAWKLLFGPWDSETKAAVLGTFIFWIAFSMLFRESYTERLAHLLAAAVAIIPAFIWCKLFLQYHRERLSVVLLMFFSGMLSTVPILFYDALVRGQVEFHFFFVRVVPESFSRTAESFVLGQLLSAPGLRTTLLTMMLSYFFVGLIEEVSKYWMLKQNGVPFCRSIADCVELAIIVAIGFAFAENVSNPTYFVSFVKQYLLNPEHRDWAAFFGNVVGRSVLTTMVHVVSTGIVGYCAGLALFATPYMKDTEKLGAHHRIADALHVLLRIDRTVIFRVQMLLIGLVVGSCLHAFSNFLVTLPDVLPGNPRTLGALFGSSPDSPLHYFSLLLFPSLLYVVGGFWFLTGLFMSRENEKEMPRGNIDAECVAA